MLLFLLTIGLFAIIPCSADTGNNHTFYYYAYGSNLLTRRIIIKNPSAVFHGIAKLPNYRLDFNMYSKLWNGAAATIVEDDKEEVWGTVWELDVNQIDSLDRQEGVHLHWYFPKNVTVTQLDGTKILARTYQQTFNPEKLTNGEDLPHERRPSNTYLEVIALGAIESHLPVDYIGSIFAFPTNGQMASEEIRDELGFPF